MKNSTANSNNALNSALNTEILIMQGGAIKALGKSEDGATGKVGGVLCRFTNADETDGYGDFFDSATDFRFVKGMKCPIYYDHGLNSIMGVQVLGEGILTLTVEGIAIEGEVDLTDANVKTIYEQVEQGELGWSSGTAGHLVTRTQVKTYELHGESAWHIDHWPLGLDASLTRYPAEPKNVASVKSLKSRYELEPAIVETQVKVDEAAVIEAKLLEIRREAVKLRVELLKV